MQSVAHDSADDLAADHAHDQCPVGARPQGQGNRQQEAADLLGCLVNEIWSELQLLAILGQPDVVGALGYWHERQRKHNRHKARLAEEAGKWMGQRTMTIAEPTPSSKLSVHAAL